ncbi:MAG TPA: hypothetical protein HA257_09115, partial [Candidatus Methanoperedenaceae archaeon]|nr:hypothetical protein [Candidatus Methanoperedenaceae archaeon]
MGKFTLTRWDPARGALACICKFDPAAEAQPEAMGLSIFREYSELFRMRKSLDDLVLSGSASSLKSVHITFQQIYRGLNRGCADKGAHTQGRGGHGADAILLADFHLYGGTHMDAIRKIFEERGILAPALI